MLALRLAAITTTLASGAVALSTFSAMPFAPTAAAASSPPLHDSQVPSNEETHTNNATSSASALGPPAPGYPDTYYSRTVRELLRDRPSLLHGQREAAEVCVVGGGYAGLTTAIGLAERGVRNVVLLEQKRIGWSASGRNGGFALEGFQMEADDLVKEVGEVLARKFYGQSVEALSLIKRRIHHYHIDCSPQQYGLLTASFFHGPLAELKEEVDEINVQVGSLTQVWPKNRVRSHLKSPLYHQGYYDERGFALHPLNYALGLARVAESLGVRIYEDTSATNIRDLPASSDLAAPRFVVETGDNGGSVECKHVVLAGSADITPTLDGPLARAVVPVYTYIMVTEPLSTEQWSVAMEDAPFMVCDDRFALNYYRMLPDNRLLWGGFAQAYPISDAKLASVMMDDLLSVYPQLKDRVRPECVWGGQMGFPVREMPLIGQSRDGVWYAVGFGGHGVVPTTLAGELLASAIADGDTRWRDYAEHFPPKYAGWPVARAGAQLMYWAYQLGDAWALWRQGRAPDDQ